MGDENVMKISIAVDNVTLITEIRIRLEVDDATSDFERNYFLKENKCVKENW